MSLWKQLKFDEEVYSVWSGPNYIYDTHKLRLVYSSLVSPKTTYDVDMTTERKETLKIQDVPLYDKSQYVSLRVEATSKDGRKIPMSLVFHKSLTDHVKASSAATTAGSVQLGEKKPVPIILYGYGRFVYLLQNLFI
jgi:protease II